MGQAARPSRLARPEGTRMTRPTPRRRRHCKCKEKRCQNKGPSTHRRDCKRVPLLEPPQRLADRPAALAPRRRGRLFLVRPPRRLVPHARPRPCLGLPARRAAGRRGLRQALKGGEVTGEGDGGARGAQAEAALGAVGFDSDLLRGVVWARGAIEPVRPACAVGVGGKGAGFTASKIASHKRHVLPKPLVVPTSLDMPWVDTEQGTGSGWGGAGSRDRPAASRPPPSGRPSRAARSDRTAAASLRAGPAAGAPAAGPGRWGGSPRETPGQGFWEIQRGRVATPCSRCKGGADNACCRGREALARGAWRAQCVAGQGARGARARAGRTWAFLVRVL